MNKLINKELFSKMLKKASESERKRSHNNFHEKLDDQVQRLCIALTPGTYLRPHKHNPSKWELMLILEGCITLVLFDKSGSIEEKIEVSVSGETKGIEIPPGQFHTILLNSETAVLIEIKPGPFIPNTTENFASWSPEEGSNESKLFLEWAEKAKTGEKYHLIS